MRRETSPLGTAAGLISGFAKRVILAALLVLLIFEGTRVSFAFGHAIFYQEPVDAAPGTDKTVELSQGATIQDVGKLLKEDGIIRNDLAFTIQGTLYKTAVYPGNYTFNTSMTTKEILEKLNTDAQANEKAQTESAVDETDAGNVIGGGDELGTDAADASADAGTDEGADTAAEGGDVGAGAADGQ